MEFEFKNISTLNIMYKTLPTLIKEIGNNFVIDNFASYTIEFSSSKALEASNTFEFRLNIKKEDRFFHIFSIIHSLKQNIEFTKLDNNQELVYVLDLFNIVINKGVIDFDKYDFFVISNMGKYNVRFVINSGKDMDIGKSLYLDIQSIRIAIIDELVNNKFNYYFNIFNYGLKSFIGGYLLSYFITGKVIPSTFMLSNFMAYFAKPTNQITNG
jgi:hypothetical protein